MPVKFQDYYETLGVDRSASQEDLQKAFRKLARTTHPDVNSDPASEEKFKEINEAYEVLKDPEKRKRYDALGSNWQAGQDFRPPPGGGDFEFHFGGGGASGFSDFFESLFGGTGRGGGFDPFSDLSGAGRTATFETRGGAYGPRVRGRGGDQEADIEIALEEAARGATRAVQIELVDPNARRGQGRSTRTLQVKIPAGVVEGSKIRLAGQGTPGPAGAPNGDLYLRARLRPHPRFKVEGRNLRTTVDLAPWEAALGTEVSIPTLGSKVTLKIPPGTASGQTLRLRGKGLPHPKGTDGDLLVGVKVVTPKELSPRERELFESLAKESSFNPRRG